jgi:hypothetical protein
MFLDSEGRYYLQHYADAMLNDPSRGYSCSEATLSFDPDVDSTGTEVAFHEADFPKLTDEPQVLQFGPDGALDPTKVALGKDAKKSMMADQLRVTATSTDDWKSDPDFPQMDDLGRSKDHASYGKGTGLEAALQAKYPDRKVGTPTPRKPVASPGKPAAAAVSATDMIYEAQSLIDFADALLKAGVKVVAMKGCEDAADAEDNPLMAELLEDFEPKEVIVTHTEPDPEPNSDSDEDSDDEPSNTMPQIQLKRKGALILSRLSLMCCRGLSTALGPGVCLRSV